MKRSARVTEWRRVKLLGKVTALALSLIIACGPSASDPGTDGVLHFLKACDTDAQCGDKLACECGMCTEACVASSDCSEFGKEARCVSASSACGTSAAPASVPAGGLCTLACSTNEDCGGEGLDLVCENQRCVPTPMEPGPLECTVGSICADLDCASGTVESPGSQEGCCTCVDRCVSGPMVAVDIATLTGRLSQTLFAEPPSAEFTARVAAGKLDTAGAVGCFAREMLADPMAEHGIARFIEQWIGPFDLVSALERAKNPSPVDTAASMTEATFAFASEAILRGDGLLSNLLLDRYAYLNDLNGAWYGDSTLTQRTLQRVELDVSQRVGLFTREYFLAGTGKGSGIVARGLDVRRTLLCTQIPPPPAGLMFTFDDTMADTKRGQFEAHRSDPACVGCHQLFDPIGFAFAQFDALGAFQTVEYGVPIDTSAEIVSAGALDGTYAGIEDMMTAIAADPDVHACVVEHWFNYVFQRPADPPTISDAARFIVTKATTPEGFSLREMIVLTTETPGFIGEAGR